MTDERIYFVMEFISGATLTKAIEHLQSQESRDERQIRFIIAQLVFGVSKLHKNYIMLRNIKKSNLMLDCQGYLKIIDFNYAKSLSRENLFARTPIGPPENQPPEMIKRQSYTFTADWWAVGLIAYEMMFNFRPFKATAQLKIDKAIVNQELQIPNQRRKNHSDAFRSFITGLL